MGNISLPQRRRVLGCMAAFLPCALFCGCKSSNSEGHSESKKQRLVNLGLLANVPLGRSMRTLERLMLLRDERGLAALELVCSHQGCAVVSANAGFICPCHGAQFSNDGAVIQGPANRDLRWLELGLSVQNELLVYFDRTVAANWRLAAAV